MRCPKCGYITYDNLEVCLKCNKDITGASELLQGGVQKVAAPMFLNLQPDVETDQGDEHDMFADDLDTDDEYIDPDLDVLMGEDSPNDEDEIGLEIEMEEDDDSEFEISMDDDDDDDEIEIELDSESDEVEIDFNQFEDEISLDGDEDIEIVAEESGPELESEFEIELPDELMDMSDLSPPAFAEESESFLDGPASLSAEEPAEEAEGLGGIDFDLGLDSLVEDEAAENLVEKETVVALDDIDFSDTLSGPVVEKGADSGDIGMDDDLNFDLDLGGISIHEDV